MDILDSYPEYKDTSVLDTLRVTEYGYLDQDQQVYLDYTGAGLAARSQYQAHENRLANGAFGNPHSANPTSEAATSLVERTRTRILEHLNASPEEYAVVFTANATGAARLVAESYPFRRRARLVLTLDNHNSVNGVREFAHRRGAKVVYVNTQAPELRVDEEDVIAALRDPHRRRRGQSWRRCLNMKTKDRGAGAQETRRNGLFAFPAQSNFSGVRHPLSWVPLAQGRGYDVLLDAAAFLPTAKLDLSAVQPEFVVMSWYKVMGYPTGVGCLVARRDALARLARPWFSGGTVRMATVGKGMEWHVMAGDEAAFEDGTVNFLSIPDVAVGLDFLAGVVGMDVIATRVRCLTGWFLERLDRLAHSDGSRMARLYGPTDVEARGGTVCFNLLDARGRVVDDRLVATESAAAGISLRTGCFCNPGGGEAAFGIDEEAVRRVRASGEWLLLQQERGISLPFMPILGAVRVSFGVASTTRDVDRFFDFVETTYRDRVTTAEGLPPRQGC
ncbi:aminotransferase class-V [Sodiomyces alkalinus F11]|uniref:Aminotransferase class-V n=1 Tax=Sodiomyces alkalinus (strain CBS 110278 / VKM F-3762 / F11) TaxID=1314773 RepID=A0A3N2PU47_SODAK|nr:aminotransferase class-V [Sodiomyces alkalinus F11]ROT37846.1 aminotransferase class-V [Sodiomyces alkalinus F11]